MRWPEVIYQEVNKSRLTINLIKYRGGEKKRTYYKVSSGAME